MKKIFIFLFLLGNVGFSSPAFSQYYGGYVPNYNTGYGSYGGYYFNSNAWSTAAFAVGQFFGTVQNVWSAVEYDNALNKQIEVRQNNLENYKSVQRYYTEGIPPFAPVTPEGKLRSPKITWQDVEQIR